MDDFRVFIAEMKNDVEIIMKNETDDLQRLTDINKTQQTISSLAMNILKSWHVTLSKIRNKQRIRKERITGITTEGQNTLNKMIELMRKCRDVNNSDDEESGCSDAHGKTDCRVDRPMHKKRRHEIPSCKENVSDTSIITNETHASRETEAIVDSIPDSCADNAISNNTVAIKSECDTRNDELIDKDINGDINNDFSDNNIFIEEHSILKSDAGNEKDANDEDETRRTMSTLAKDVAGSKPGYVNSTASVSATRAPIDIVPRTATTATTSVNAVAKAPVAVVGSVAEQQNEKLYVPLLQDQPIEASTMVAEKRRNTYSIVKAIENIKGMKNVKTVDQNIRLTKTKQEKSEKETEEQSTEVPLPRLLIRIPDNEDISFKHRKRSLHNAGKRQSYSRDK